MVALLVCDLIGSAKEEHLLCPSIHLNILHRIKDFYFLSKDSYSIP